MPACFLVLTPPFLLSSYFLPRPCTTFLWSRRWAESARRRHMTPLPRRPFLRVRGAPAPDLGSLLQPALRPPSSQLIQESLTCLLIPLRQTDVDSRQGRGTGPQDPLCSGDQDSSRDGRRLGGRLPATQDPLASPSPGRGVHLLRHKRPGYYALPPHLLPRPLEVTLESPETTAHWAMLMACQLSGLRAQVRSFLSKQGARISPLTLSTCS